MRPFGGHAIRTIAWERFDPATVGPDVDTIIISASDPLSGVDAIAAIRDAGDTHPVLLVPDDSPGWRQVAASRLPGADVVLGGIRSLPDYVPSADYPHESGLWEDLEQSEDTREAARVIDLRRHIPRGGSRRMLRERMGDQPNDIASAVRDFTTDLSGDRPTSDTPGVLDTPDAHDSAVQQRRDTMFTDSGPFAPPRAEPPPLARPPLTTPPPTAPPETSSPAVPTVSVPPPAAPPPAVPPAAPPSAAPPPAGPPPPPAPLSPPPLSPGGVIGPPATPAPVLPSVEVATPTAAANTARADGLPRRPRRLAEAATPAADVADTGSRRRHSRASSDPAVLVPALLSCLDRLDSLADTATAVAEFVMERVATDAVDILVPEGDAWRTVRTVGTAAGAGAVTDVVDVPGLVAWLESFDTPVVLDGHDLAAPGSWVLATLVRGNGPSVAVVLCWREPGRGVFEASSVTNMAELAVDATQSIELAVQLRQLARALSGFAD